MNNILGDDLSADIHSYHVKKRFLFRTTLNRFYTLCVALLCIPSMGLANTFYVYLPTDLNALSVQKAFDKNCPMFTTTVFSRAKEFWAAYDAKQPNAIISSNHVFNQAQGLKPIVQGFVNNQAKQPYLLVTTGEVKPSLKTLKDKRIGILDMLGRKKTRDFVQSILGVTVSVRGATKPRDLMPLLNFKMVDFLLIEKPLLSYLKKRSNQTFSFVELSESYSVSGAVSNNTDLVTQNDLAKCVSTLGDQGLYQSFFRVDLMTASISL